MILKFAGGPFSPRRSAPLRAAPPPELQDTLRLDSKSLLSIVVPVFNEEEYVEAAIVRALAAPLPAGLRSEVVAVDDGSTDSSGRILDDLAARFPERIRVFHHPVNRGKGAAVRTAIERAAAMLAAMARAPRFNKWMADAILPAVGSRVPELGAGIGNMTRHLARGLRCYMATDIDEEHLSRLRVRFQGRPNLEARRCDLREDADFSGLQARFDTVVCLNVVEHVEDDLAALRRIRRTLLPGGRAIVLAPRDQAIYGSLDKALGHCRRYAAGELEARMTQAGFRVERAFPFNRIGRPGWRLNGLVLRREDFGAWQLRVFDALVPLWRRIDRLLPWPAVSIVVIGVAE